MRWMMLAVLVGCGGEVGPTTAPDVGTDSRADVAEASVPEASAPDSAGDVMAVDADPCTCAGADFGTLICDGKQASDPESCKVCGGHCPADGGVD